MRSRVVLRLQMYYFTMHDDESEDDQAHDDDEDADCDDGSQDIDDGGSHDCDSHNFIPLRIILFRYESKKKKH